MLILCQDKRLWSFQVSNTYNCGKKQKYLWIRQKYIQTSVSNPPIVCKAQCLEIIDWIAQLPILSFVNVNFMLGMDGFEKVVTNYFLQAALYALVPSIV